LNHNQYDEEPIGLHWQYQSSNGLMEHSIKIIPTSTGKGIENVECLRMRAFCHFLLDYLPEEGLEEVKNSLLEAIDFYSEPKEILEYCQPNESFEVAIGEGYERPVFQIAED
jgi:hypothetical protein